MTKAQVKPSELDPINLEVEITKHKMSYADLQTFKEARDAGDPSAQGSLVEYVKEKFYKDKNIVVVPDFSGAKIGTKIEYEKADDITTEDLNKMHESYVDLSGIDFSGSNLKGATFEGCNLKGASFCDTDLGDVSFNDCYMPGADLRGADISNCSFNEPDFEDELLTPNHDLSPGEVSERLIHNNRIRYEDMQFSSTEPLMYQYTERNEAILELAREEYDFDKDARLLNKAKEIEDKQVEINEAYKELTYAEAYARLPGSRTGNKKYDDLNDEIAVLRKENAALKRLTFENDPDKEKVNYVVHPSITALPSIVDDVNIVKFDPAYIKRHENKKSNM